MSAKRTKAGGEYGQRAHRPGEIPARGWWQVLRRGMKEGKEDNLSVLAAGVAFFGFLALFPALIAALTLYGLVADPQQIADQTRRITDALPGSAGQLIGEQLTAAANAGGGALTIGLVIALLAALWSASSGVSNLMTAVNVAYGEEETRGFVKLRAIALVLTLGVIAFALLTLALVAVVPAVFSALDLGLAGRIGGEVVRWLLLIGLFTVSLAVLYRIAPDRAAPRWRWVSTGAGLATVLWIVASVGFSLYISFFGNYNKTYGALAGVVVLMLWLYLTSYLVLLGAEINAEAERQTAVDTTTGDPLPAGERDAVSADTQAREARGRGRVAQPTGPRPHGA
ncbi:YihY/virulence factor BrkB family protein [Prauserella sp. PE36]|uniref:YihY/virulence factor BrkB family protein n=1 Tax=Prauserella sp. PE36 TaxID=1504709 RepID=UPI000D98BCF1|nr:YihY/virulence factor BrkB family protein [Prauserella sp. PE36]PXY25250.1 ribonuclease BN [Prauserella coralliicola]RBM15603.1 YihY/virulence factor BrkB family protein [Prauserella sp. PE36]